MASPAADRAPDRADAPQRRCLVTRRAGARDHLVRFVLDPDQRVLPDVDERLPGRGMWLSADRDVVNKAVAGRLFARAARAPATAAADLAETVERLLARRALEGLGLARRAGEVVTGFEQVRAFLRASQAVVLIAAADGAADGRLKLRRLAPELPLITAFSRGELGASLGREEVVHAAVAPGGLARRLLRDVERLAGFRPDALELSEGAAQGRRGEPRETTGPT
ncbi:MAG TPA: RNA-binding protein [Geminicoccaceae bacterium]|nr:RNA-binding protein [Geminicoccaceae bacterium]